MSLFLVAPALFAAAKRYLCVAEKSTGFRYNFITRNWEPANFRVANERHLVKFNKTRFQVTFNSFSDVRASFLLDCSNLIKDGDARENNGISRSLVI
jgi:hypothetical protein